jgi:hypothetical protein
MGGWQDFPKTARMTPGGHFDSTPTPTKPNSRVRTCDDSQIIEPRRVAGHTGLEKAEQSIFLFAMHKRWSPILAAVFFAVGVKIL